MSFPFVVLQQAGATVAGCCGAAIGGGGGGALVREGNEESMHCFLSLGLQLRELVCLVQ